MGEGEGGLNGGERGREGLGDDGHHLRQRGGQNTMTMGELQSRVCKGEWAREDAHVCPGVGRAACLGCSRRRVERNPHTVRVKAWGSGGGEHAVSCSRRRPATCIVEHMHGPCADTAASSQKAPEGPGEATERVALPEGWPASPQLTLVCRRWR